MKTPRVTVIIPVYNGERYIAEAIDSVLAQTEPCRLIVVDDGSTDDTITVAVAAGAGSLPYPLHYIASLSPNRGAATALNHGIQHADTEFVAWLSHDDVFMPEKIERQLAVMTYMGDACYTDFDIIDADGVLVEHVKAKPPIPPDMFRQICVRNLINGSSMLLRRDVFDRIGYFREDLPVDVDGEMWLRMIGAGMNLVHVPQILLKYRRHGGQLSANRELMGRTKDRVRAEAIEATPPERAFPAARRESASYRRLAVQLSAQGLTLAAAAAAEKHKSLDHSEAADLHTDL